MLDEDDEMKLTRAETAYEDYVISLIAGKTAEQVDETEFTPEQIEHAGHYARNVKMFGKLNNPEDFERNYLEEVVMNGPDIREFEAEMEYRTKYGEGSRSCFSEICADAPCLCGEYDGRDDEFIREMLKGAEATDYMQEDDIQLAPDEEISPEEIETYADLI